MVHLGMHLQVGCPESGVEEAVARLTAAGYKVLALVACLTWAAPIRQLRQSHGHHAAPVYARSDAPQHA